MKIELRNFKYAAFASEETPCFSATVYIDGAKAGEARNDGHGGATLIHPRALNDRLNTYAKTLPMIVSEFVEDDNGPLTYPPDAETLILDLVTDTLIARDVKRSMASKAVFVRDGKLMETRKLTAAQLASIKNDPEAKTKLKADVILNTLPFNEAVALYRKHG